MTLAFVSYSRKDASFARELISAFEARKLETWIDWEDIPPSQDWLVQIQHGIEAADSFIFLISVDSVKSRVCRDEIAHAVRNNKRLIPVVVREVDPSEAPPEISKLHWIFFRAGQDDFQSSFQKLLEAIHTDFEWVQAHRRLQVRALEWDRRNKENSLLLHGKDLQLAEQQLVATASKDPQPTDLQRAYVLASRKQSDRQRRLLTGLSVGAAIIMCCLGSIGIYEAIRAGNQARIAAENEQTAIRNEATAVSRQLAAEALNQLNLDPSLSFLLSLEALKSADTYEARNSIATDLTFSPYLSRFLYGNPNFTTSVAFSPDGTLLAAGSCAEIGRGIGISLCAPDEIRMIDVATGKQTMIMKEAGQDGEVFSFVHSLAFSPDGQTLASGSDDGVISLWNLRTGEVLNPTLGNQNGKVIELLFDTSGTRLASADGTTVNVWDVTNGQLLRTTNGLSVSLLPDNRFVVISEVSPYLQLVDVEAGNPLGSPVTADGVVFRAEYSPASNLLAVAYQDNSISVYEMTGGSRVVGPSKIHLKGITRLVFSPDGSMLASASIDKTVGLWNLKDKSTGVPLVGHTDLVNSVAFSPDGLWLASSAGNWNNFSRDNHIILWDLKRQRTLRRSLSFDIDEVSALDVNPQVKDMLAIGGNGNIYFWDWAKDEVIGELPFENNGIVSSIDFSPDGTAMVSTGRTLTLWNLAVAPAQGLPLMEAAEGLDRAKFSPDGSKIAAVDRQGNLTLWSMSTHQQLGPVISTTPADLGHSLVFSRDGSTVAVGGNEAVLINASDGRETARWSPLGEGGGYLWASDFTPDLFSFVSIGSVDRYNYLQNIFTGGVVGRPFLQFNLANYAVFNPDASLLAIADEAVDTESRPGGIILWDPHSQQAYGEPLYGNGQRIVAMTFTPDGKSLIVGEPFRTVFVWDMDMESWKSRLCKMANRNLTPDEWNYYFPDETYRTTCPNY